MSKAVKSVGRTVKGAVRSVGRVVKGATRVVRRVARGVVGVAKGVFRGIGRVLSRVVKSPIGRAVMAAATIYFGGAAIMGAIGGAGASTGFLGTIGGAVKGAGAGIGSAWSGLTGAAGAAMSGNLGAAGSSLSQGFMGANAAGAGAVAPAAAATSAIAPSATGAAATGAAAPAAASSGMSPLTQYGLIQGATQLVGGAVQGYGQQKALEEQRSYEDQKAAEELARRDTNMQTQFQFSDAQGTGFAGPQPMPTYGGSQVSGGPALLQGGLVANQMYPSTLTANRFPTFNPAYSRFV